ncbi:MAG TPA: NAD(P)H-dependent oxidoreductase [Solirubrobacteraceae bacterium]|nr:NAD(P)H-dependent oxidoreductase [Solirubrobacteraceae bacterium]
MRVLGITGSLRSNSHNGRLLRAAAQLLPPDAEFVQFGGLKAIPPFDEDDELAPGDAVEAWRAELERADALLFATPEYNHSIPGALKNAVDWASRPFATAALRNKPAAVIGTSTGMFGAVWAQAELRKSLAAAGARVIDRELPVPGAENAFAPDGKLAEHEQTLALGEILAELLEEARRRSAAPVAPAPLAAAA